ncbi:MAG: hypothetical protein OEL57_05525 [Trichlorobacter sp.]|uniref:hypothetical protein n=1 Tax=Trichlorobacter sp. TaxID=2911007 RepID=UPI00256145AE|nr:hypothetical protein [Trichlorobacter sp.]MDK9717354.1 hypothetical protein [Trichlorobacter sp.]
MVPTILSGIMPTELGWEITFIISLPRSAEGMGQAAVQSLWAVTFVLGDYLHSKPVSWPSISSTRSISCN